MCVFGDPAYPLRVHLQAPFRHGILTPMMEGYNAEMSSVRVTVEWLFGDIINDFKFLDFKKNLREVCCKDQLRSCNIEKTDFPKLCQNKGLGELVLKI